MGKAKCWLVGGLLGCQTEPGSIPNPGGSGLSRKPRPSPTSACSVQKTLAALGAISRAEFPSPGGDPWGVDCRAYQEVAGGSVLGPVCSLISNL